MKRKLIPPVIVLLYTAFIVGLFQLTSLAVPCLADPGTAHEFAECTQTAAMDVFLLSSLAGLVLIGISAYILKVLGIISFKSVFVVLVICTTIAIVGYYGYGRLIAAKILQSAIYVETGTQ